MDQFHKDDQIKLLDNKNEKIAKTGSKGISKLALHCDTLDQGTEAFMQWLSSDDKMSASSNPIILSNSCTVNTLFYTIIPSIMM